MNPTHIDRIQHLNIMYQTGNSALSPHFRAVLDDIRDGIPIILVDDMSRENEGDLMLAAEKATVNNIAFMARWGRGIMCLPSDGWVLDGLQIPMMVPPELATDPWHTAFTVSVDAKEGVTTGVSAADRVRTIQVMTNPESRPWDLAKPGHLFPLRARDELLAERHGHTEASVTLAEIVGFYPVAVIAEIMNDDGSMARMPELEALSKLHGLKILSIPEIIAELGL